MQFVTIKTFSPKLSEFTGFWIAFLVSTLTLLVLWSTIFILF